MLNIVIFGAPGSGKGTQSELIIKKYNLHHISTGEILRQEIDNQTEFGRLAAQYTNQGHFVPDDVIIKMFAEVLDKTQHSKGYIFDGFPRNILQATTLDNLLRERKMPIVAAFSLTVEDADVIERLTRRGKLTGRADDNIETIKHRLEVYKEHTEPLKDYYKKQGKLFIIKGDNSIENVFDEISQVIDRLLYLQ
ncbi:MAG: adenylate kinase [Candidatus Symbiothrix sp.]|jgi:adenylate kinase|nr:adenylate kinase [Candidatus Symbiothrix sp.]